MAAARGALTRRREALGISKTRLAGILDVNRTTIHRWETGESDPMAKHRSPLARALQVTVLQLDQLLKDDQADGSLALSGRSLQQAPLGTVADDRGGEDVDRRRFIAGIVATGVGAAFAGPGGDQAQQAAVLQAAVDRAVRLEQRSQYAALAVLLPGLLSDAQLTMTDADDLFGQQVARQLSTVQVVNAFVLVKQDQPFEAQTAATEALNTARQVNDPVLVGTVLRCLGETYMRGETHDLAADLALEGASHISRHRAADPEALAVQGAGLLSAASACARSGHRAEAMQLLAAAERCADELRHDYVGSVVFGPTNVAIHRVAFEVELGDPVEALRQAEDLTVRPRPGLNERQARYLLDVARAQAEIGQGAEAVVTLLEAESIAPEEIRTHRHSRAVLDGLLTSSRGGVSMELRPLAQRCGVLAA